MPRPPTAVGPAIGLAVGAVVLAFRFLGWLVPLDLALYDRMLAALPANAGASPVALVWIREQELDYRRAPRAIPGVALADLLDSRVDPSLVVGRVAIVGTRSPSVKDEFETPAGERVYGAEFHASAVDQLLRLAAGEKPIGASSDWVEVLATLAWCATAGLLGTRLRSPLGLAVAVGAALLALAAGGAAALRSAALWVPVAAPAVGGTAALGLSLAFVAQRERTEKAVAVRLFGTYVSRAVVDEIWRQRELFMEGGRPRPEEIMVTVLLSDLSGYTSASEKVEPAEVMRWIGSYMDAMAGLVERHGGIVNDFLGDGLMATFGAPIRR